MIYPRLLNVGKSKGRVSRDGVLSLQTLSLLAGTQHVTGLTTLVDSDDLELLAARRTLQTTPHLLEGSELVKGQFPSEHGVRGLLALDQTLLQALDERHGLLHLTQLADLGVQLLVVEGEAEGVEGLADQVDVLLLPLGVLLRGEDGDLLGLARVEGAGLTLGQLLGEVGLGGGDAGGGVADVARCGQQLRGRLGDLGEAGEVDGLGL